MVNSLLALIAVAIGGFLYYKQKSDSADALLTNQQTKEELLKKDKEIMINDALSQVEESKRAEVEEKIKDIKNVSNEELEAYFKDLLKK